MSVDLVKSININPACKTISITSACNNVTPRRYETWNPLGEGSPFTFETWLRAFASDCFGGSAQFLPSCESKAHEAYLRTCEEMGGDWGYAYNVWGVLDGPEYDAFKQAWCDKFIDFVLNGARDARKFHMTRGGRSVSVYVRRGQHGGLAGHYRYTNNPKTVTWIRQQVIRTKLSGFDAKVVGQG